MQRLPRCPVPPNNSRHLFTRWLSGHHLSLGIFSPLPLFGDCGSRPLAKWTAGLLLFLREFFIQSSTCCNWGLGSGSAWFWSPALPIKHEGAEQYGRELSGDRAMPELLPKTQAGSKSVALRWKHLWGGTMGVYLNRWPCRERLQDPLPTAGWQADLFLWALKAHTVGQAKIRRDLLRPHSFSIKWKEKKTKKRLFENYHPLSKWPVSIIQLMFSVYFI